MHIRFFSLISIFTIAGYSAWAQAPEERAEIEPQTVAPFKAGERLVYSLKWGPFTVGSATLEVLNETNMFGEPGYHIRFSVQTNDFADSFYKVRTQIETFPTTSMEKSLHYRANQKEGKRDRKFSVMMNWTENEIRRIEDGVLREPLTPDGPMHDPLSILFYFRTAELAEGTQLPLPATDGRKLINVDAKIAKRERIRVPAGRFETYRVQPNMKDLGGVFRKSKDAALDIWFSDDARRIPVKLKSKVRVGSFSANLRKIEYFEPEPLAPEEENQMLKTFESELASAKSAPADT